MYKIQRFCLEITLNLGRNVKDREENPIATGTKSIYFLGMKYLNWPKQ